NRCFREPHGQAPALAQRDVIGSPIRHSVPLLLDVMTAILVRFEWHGGGPASGNGARRGRPWGLYLVCFGSAARGILAAYRRNLGHFGRSDERRGAGRWSCRRRVRAPRWRAPGAASPGRLY